MSKKNQPTPGLPPSLSPSNFFYIRCRKKTLNKNYVEFEFDFRIFKFS